MLSTWLVPKITWKNLINQKARNQGGKIEQKKGGGAGDNLNCLSSDPGQNKIREYADQNKNNQTYKNKNVCQNNSWGHDKASFKNSN